MGFFDRAEEFITQTEIQREALGSAEIILHITAVDFPAVIHVMQAGNRAEIGDAQQEGGKCRASGAGRCRIIRELAAEAHITARGRRLKKRELLVPNFRAEPEGVAPAHPGEVVGQNKTVLYFTRRKESGAADGSGAVAEINFRQATIQGRERHPGETDPERGIACDVFVKIQLVSMRVDAVVTQPDLIDHGRGKQMGLAQRDASI